MYFSGSWLQVTEGDSSCHHERDYFGRKKSISENVKKEKGKTYRPILGKDL